MQEYCRSHDLQPVPTVKELSGMRNKFKFAAIFANWKRPPKWVSSAIPNLGCVSVDGMEYKKKFAALNKQRWIVIIGVDVLSQFMAAYAFPNKTQQSWNTALESFITKDFPCCRRFLVDRDVAITGEAYQRHMKQKWNVDFMHLRSNSKSVWAERGVRSLKVRLSQACLLSNTNNWLQFLDGIVADLNQKPCRNTSIKRCDVNKNNVMKVLAEMHGIKDWSPLYNTSVISNISAPMYRAIGFKFAENSKVLLSRSSNYTVKFGSFTKKSQEGNYTKTVYTIEDAFLKASADDFFCVMYKLKGMPQLWYQEDLLPVSFTEEPGAPDLEAIDRKKRAASAKKRRERH
jgi:hypothetical protein